ncbi:hypothetical protein ACFX2G_044725 [Malus domestica]
MPFSSIVPSQRQLPQRNGKFQSNSYVHKGNSLVRKPPVAALQSSHGFSSAVYRLNSSGIDGLKKSARSDSRVDVENPPSLMRTGETNAPLDRVYASSPVSEPLSGETKLDPMNSLETKDLQTIVKDSLTTSDYQENHSGPLNKLENQTVLHDGNLAPPNTKNIVYVKRKLNQLVATSRSSSHPLLQLEATRVVAAVEKRKREHNGAACITLGSKIRNNLSADFISIDVSDEEEAGENNDPIREQASYCDSDSSELELDELDRFKTNAS